MEETLKFKKIEPFCFWGPESIIHTKDQAEKIIKDNTYYFIIVGCLALVIFLFLTFVKPIHGLPVNLLPIAGFFYLLTAIILRRVKSRVISIMILTAVSGTLLYKLLQGDFEWTFLFNLFLFVAAIRCVKATFYLQN
jgi:hypothetical protein